MKAILTNNKTSKKLITLILTLLAFVCFITSVAIYRYGNADATLSGVNFEDCYLINTELDLPDGTISVGGTQKTASPVIYLPDGSAYSAEKFTLDQVGKYFVEYSAVIDNKSYSVKESFVVKNYLYSNSVTGEGFNYLEEDGVSGIKFNIKAGEKFNYNSAIDFSDNTKENTFLKFDLTPTTLGTADANVIYVTLTDVHDSDNVITILIKKGPNVGSPYVSYITSGYTGVTKLGHGIVDGKEAIIKEPSDFGFEFNNGFAGEFDTTEQNAFELRFDYDKKQLWAKDGSDLKLVCDYAKDFEEIWLGFTTDKALLSIWAEDYVSADITKPLSAIVMDIDGVDLQDGTDSSGSSLPADVTEAPMPIVDFGVYENENNIPRAMVGYGYKVFDASVKSLYGNEKLSTRVFFGYNTSTRYEVSVVDGEFTPDNAGMYSIVYKCVDAFGNVSETVVDVEAISSASAQMVVTVPGYADHDTCNVGTQFVLVPIADVIVENNLGNYQLSLTATHVDSGLVIDVENNVFVANYGGEWEITYTAVDYVGRVGEFTYEANVIVNDTVDFESGPVKNLGKYLIANAKNPVPTVNYIDYNVGPEVVAVETVYLESLSGTKIVDAVNGYITPTTAGQYRLVYEATSEKNVTTTKKQDVTVVDVGYNDVDNFHLGKYFYSEDIVGYTHTTQFVSFTLGAGGVADFIRPMNATNLNFSFLLETKPVADERIVITFTDINNKDQVLKVEFFETGLKAKFNDGESKAINAVLGGNLQCNVSLKEGIFTAGGASFIVETFLNGDEFNGFDSMLVDMSIEVLNKTTETKFKVSEVGNQSFYRMTGIADASEIDFRPPQLNSYDIPSGVMLKGQTINIGKALYTDIIDPSASGTLTVVMTTTAGAQVILSSTDGVKLENVATDRNYEVLLNDTGKVTLRYNVSDSSVSGVEERNLQVITREAPDIQIEQGPTTGSVGKGIDVGQANIPGMDVEVHIFVRPPVGRMKAVDTTKMKFKAEVAGKYEIVYVAIDTFGNLAVKSYFVNVA